MIGQHKLLTRGDGHPRKGLDESYFKICTLIEESLSNSKNVVDRVEVERRDIDSQ